MRRTILLIILAGFVGMKAGYELSSYINRPIEATDIVTQTVEPGRRDWFPPSCPRELTLQDGSRWSPPSWSRSDCRIYMQWSAK